MIRFLCPTCSAKVQAPDEKAAQSGRCPKCAGTFIVPQAGGLDLQIATQLPPAPIENPPELPQLPQDELIEAPLTEAPARSTIARAPNPAPRPGAIDDDVPESFTQPTQSRKFHPLTIATAVAFLLVIVITVIKLSTSPATTEAKAPSKPARTPWFTFVPPDDSNPPRDKTRPAPTTQRAPQHYRPTAKESAFSPSIIRPEFEERVAFDPPARFNTNVSRPVKPILEFPTAPIVAAPIAADQTIYLASLDGQLYAIDSDSLKFSEQKNLNYPVLRLLVRDSRLIAQPKGQFRKTLIDFSHTVEIADPEDAEPTEKLVPTAGKTGPQT